MDSTVVRKALRKIGCTITEGGKHRKVRYEVDGVWIGNTTLPRKPKTDVNRNWLSQIRRATHIASDEDLKALGRCHRSAEEHVEHLKSLGVI